MTMDVDLRHFIVRHTDFRGVGSVVEPGRHVQAGSCAGAANEPKHDAQATQRLACPVDAHRAKKAMFHGIPFRRSGGIMADGDFQSVRVRPALQFSFPQPTTTAVAPARIGFDENLPGFRILPFAASTPPLAQRIDGELGCFRRDTDAYVSGISRRIVDAVGSRPAL